MRIVSTFHSSSSVVDSLKCHLADNDTEHLVVAMLDRLEVYSLGSHGLHCVHRLLCHGRIASIAAAPVSGTDRSNILVLLDQPTPELLLVSLSGDTISFKKSLSLVEQARAAEFLTKVIVDPTGTVAVVSCYIGKLTVVRLHDGEFNASDAIPLNIPELNILELTFLPSSSESVFVTALLHYDSSRRIQLLAREIDFDSGPIPELSSPTDLLPRTIIPNKNIFIPSSDNTPRLVSVGTLEGGGVLVIGGKKALFYGFADEEEQRLLKNKRNRLEKRKNSKNPAEVEKAKEKEKERSNRKRRARHELQWPFSEITAICPIHSTNRWLIGDAFGRLSLLCAESLATQGLILIPLGEMSSPSSLTYLSNQHLFLGSSKGDSFVVKILSKPLTQTDAPTLPIPDEIVTINPSALHTVTTKGKQRAIETEDNYESLGSILKTSGSFLETVQTFKNIGPILDATVVSDGGGETQVVTCSGGCNTGSVNILRSGANYQEIAVVKDLPGIRRIWPIKKFFEEGTHTRLALSTAQSTHILRLGHNNSISYDESSGRGFVTSQPTIAMSNVVRKNDTVYENGTFVVQVTPTGVRLLEHEMGLDDYDQVGSDWLPPNGGRIVAASIHASLIALGVSNGERHELIVLRMVDIKKQSDTVLEVFGRVNVLYEISSVSCVPLDKSMKFTHRVIVAYWESNKVEIFGFNRPEDRMTSQFLSPPLPSLPQSLLLFNFGTNQQPGEDYHPYLLVGLCNGSVASFSYTVENKEAKLSDRKIVANLGPSPVFLTPCIVDGQNVVFASGSRGSLLSWQNQRIRNSTLLLKDVAIASKLDTEQHPNSFLVANHEGFSIGRISDLDHMHIRTVSLGTYIPRRILHDPRSHAFGIAVNRTEARLTGAPEPAYKNHFWLLDESTFERLHEFSLPQDEVITALAALDFEDHQYFCIGTYIFKSDEGEPSSGRILLLKAETSGNTTILKQEAEIQTGGAVYALSIFDHKLLAATIGSAIVLFSPERSDSDAESSLVLRRLAEKNQNYVATNLDTHGQTLLVGDMLGSVSSWKVTRNKAAKPENSNSRNNSASRNLVHNDTSTGSQQTAELSLIKRDFHPLCPTTIISTDEGGLVGADLQTNLFSFNTALERDGYFHLGDMVTKFVRGSLVSTDSSNKNKLEAESVFVTSSGRIGVIINVKDVDTGLHLTNVERNLRYVKGNAGGTSIAKFRAPRTSFGKPMDGAVGFLDGDFLEQVLTLSPEELNRVMSGKNPGEKLKMSVEDMKDIIEQLQSLH